LKELAEQLERQKEIEEMEKRREGVKFQNMV
jgi:hypothetical protein